MIAQGQPLTTTERRDLDRRRAMNDVLSLTTSGLSARSEAAVRAALLRHVDPLLDLADDAAVALLELAALDRRITNHVQACGCVFGAPCLRYRLHQARRERLRARADKAMRALLAGRR